MEAKKFRVFLNAINTHDFAETGRNMFISRSAVMQQIAKLEKELGVKLFNRTTHEIKPTEAGEALIPLATKLIQTEDEIIRTMHNSSNTITIGTIYRNLKFLPVVGIKLKLIFQVLKLNFRSYIVSKKLIIKLI